MKYEQGILLKSAAMVLAIALTAYAEFPLGSMGPRNLGIQYGLAFRGQDITAQDIPSHEIFHAFSLGYSPIPYVGLEGGLALDRFSVDRYKSTRFRGEYGISPLFGLILATPYALEFARLIGGVRAMFLNSEDANGFSYNGSILNPWISALIAPSAYFDFQVGVRGHSIDGRMRAPGGSEQVFSNRNTIRGFGSFTIKSPSEWAFLTLDIDVSPEVDRDWSNGPQESSIAVSFGTLLGWKKKSDAGTSAPPYFPAYPEMKDKLEKMAEEIE